MIPKLTKDIAKKGNYGTVFLMNINTKIFQKILVKLLQKYVKRTTYYEVYPEWGLSRNARLT